jgi:RNA-directed DNA polymerase
MRTLEDLIEEAIKAEAEKLTLRFQSYHNRIERIHQQNQARLKEAPSKILTTPPYWSVSKTFNPFYVHKHARAIARSVTKKIREGTYRPRTPQSQNVPKLGGGTRIVNIFEIPDAAVSNFYFRKLLSKNRHRFSPYAYAYRDDRNVHFAVQDIHVDIKRFSRLFVAEYDFSDFFGSIQHDYLLKQLSENGFFIAPVEQRIIESFLALNNQRGIPQGTSLSLFLANLACWRLDRDFLDDGLKFARYADDTVIWSPHYDRICRAAERIAEFSRYTGVAINPYKSSGISLLVKRGFTSEFKQTKDHIEFLGYRLSSDDVSIKAAAVQRIKRNISYTLYHHLIQPLKGRELRALRIPANDEDRDLVVAVSTIRRYLYGNLTEDLLKAYLAGRYDRMTFKGLMSFYPLVTDEQ